MAARRGTYVRKDATAGTSPQDARLAVAGLVTPAGELGVVPGVLSGCVVSGMAAWTYSFGAGHYVTTRGSSDGAVIGSVDGTTPTPAVSTAPATGSRWDLIWVRQRDVDSGDSDSLAVVGVTSGASGGSPTKPYGSVPAGALVVAEAQVSAGATQTSHANVTIAQVAPRVAARGGVVEVPNAAARDLLWSAVGGHVIAYRTDERIIERRTSAGGTQSMTGAVTGTLSVPAFSLASGAAPVTVLAFTPLTHPFSGEVIVEADLVGDAVVGPNSSVKFLLTAGGTTRLTWVQNFGPGNLRDSPHIRTVATVAAGSPVTVGVTASDIGPGGTSGSAGTLSVQWTVRPGRGA